MKISVYLDQHEISNAEFASRIGVSRQTVHRYRQGRRPEWNVIAVIVKETAGAVTADDFLPAESAQEAAESSNVSVPEA